MNELKILAEIFAPTKPNRLYCNVPDVYFIYHNEWADPEVMYKDKLFNLPMDVEDLLWANYEWDCEENGNETTQEGFAYYVENHPEDVYDTLDTLIAFGMYKEV